MLYIFKRIASALKPRIREGWVVWAISTIEPDENNLTMTHVDFAWPWTSEEKVIARFRKQSNRDANLIITATRQKPSWKMFVWQLPLMYSGPFFYNLKSEEGRGGVTGQGFTRRHALFMNNLNYELSTLCTHWSMSKAGSAKMLPLKEQVSWHLTHFMSYIEPPGVEWSENPLAWPHACDQAGCGMHKNKPYCSHQSKWCKLASKIRPDIERKLERSHT